MARRRRSSLATVLFTDIVGSSEIAAELGDRRWKSVIEAHHAIVRRALRRHGGRELDTAGDGFFAVFDAQAEAIRCAAEIVQDVRAIGIEVRAGLHVGETELIAGKTGGVAVHTGARVGATAGPGEVVVSGVLRDLVPGSGIEFVDRGARRLKGVPDEVRTYSVRAVNGVDVGEPLDPVEAARRRSNISTVPRRRGAIVVGAIAGGLAVAIAAAVLSGGEPAGRDRSTPMSPIAPNTLVRIDPRGLEIADRIPLSGEALDIAAASGRVWILEDGLLEVTTPGRDDLQQTGLEFPVCALAAAGDGVIVGDCVHDRLYRVNAELRVISWLEVPRFGDVFSVLSTDAGVYVLSARFDRIIDDRLYRLDPETGDVLGQRVLRSSRTDGCTTCVVAPSADRFVEAGGYLWAFDFDDGRVVRISPTTLEVEEIEQGSQPDSIVASSDWVWVSDAGPGEIIQIDPASGKVVDRIDRYGLLTGAGAGVWALDVWRLFRINDDGRVIDEAELSYEDAGNADNPAVVVDGWLWIAVRSEDVEDI